MTILNRITGIEDSVDSQLSQIKIQNSELLSKIQDFDQKNEEKMNRTNANFESKVNQVYSSAKLKNENKISELHRNLTER